MKKKRGEESPIYKSMKSESAAYFINVHAKIGEAAIQKVAKWL
jgi:hypothetical protein